MKQERIQAQKHTDAQEFGESASCAKVPRGMVWCHQAKDGAGTCVFGSRLRHTHIEGFFRARDGMEG